MANFSPKRRKLGSCPHAMSIASSTVVQAQESPTARLVSMLGHLKDTAAKAGCKPSDLVLANIGDITGIPELPAMKEARSAAVRLFNDSCNMNGYPPYPGLTELRQVIAKDLMGRLGFAEQDQ